MLKPLCIDLFCGLGGWTEGFLAEGWDVIGFDVEQHVYGEHRYPAQLVLQDVRTIDGAQFAAEIRRRPGFMFVASSPCPEYSYMGMPWKRAKQIAAALRGQGDFPEGYKGSRTIEELNDLFEQPKRIQREASEAVGWAVPMIQENVKAAQPWVGRSQWNFGSYHLWGDVPALMPQTVRAQKFNPDGTDHGGGSWFAIADSQNRGAKLGGKSHTVDGHKRIAENWRSKAGQTAEGLKNSGGSWFAIGSPGQKVTGQNPVAAFKGPAGGWFNDNKRSGSDSQTGSGSRSGSKSPARKAASAAIAKIPFPLSSHIARVYKPFMADPEAAA